MKKLATILGCLTVFALLCGGAQAAGRAPASVKKAGELAQCRYFSVTLPEGWIMPMRMSPQPNNGMVGVFSHLPKGDPSVTIMGMQIDLSSEEMARQTTEGMEKNGVKVSNLREENGIWKFDMTVTPKGAPPMNGKGYIATNGKTGIFTNIMGSDIKAADALLKALQSPTPELFPKSVD